MSQPIIEVRNASVRFNLARQKQEGLKSYITKLLRHELLFQEFFALQDVNLTVNPGESWGFIGRNGSGKSTLLKVITGILKPYTGSVTVRGSIAPLLELGAGFDGDLTGRENIIMNGLILGMTKQEINERFDEIVSFAEIEKFLDVPLKNYSSGMKARLGFSVATTSKADILIADEVLATGDRQFQAKCEQRMQTMLNDGSTTLLYVSHAPNAVRKLCTHAMWLDGGHVKMAGPAAEVCDAYEKNKI